MTFLTNGCSVPAGDFAPDSAAVRALRTRLSSRPSATAVLQERCSKPIRVLRLAVDRPVSEETLAHLAVESADQVLTRHVRLLCGDIPLSDAWNWYVPERLSAEMNTLLERTDIPFGRVVRRTAFRREVLEARFPTETSGIVLQNRALLRRGNDDAPIALVVENYLPAALAP